MMRRCALDAGRKKGSASKRTLLTGFVASAGAGKPVIAYLAEYDALMGVSQKAVPRCAIR